MAKIERLRQRFFSGYSGDDGQADLADTALILDMPQPPLAGSKQYARACIKETQRKSGTRFCAGGGGS